MFVFGFAFDISNTFHRFMMCQYLRSGVCIDRNNDHVRHDHKQLSYCRIYKLGKLYSPSKQIILQDIDYELIKLSWNGYDVSQWEKALLCNAFSHWPSPYLWWWFIPRGNAKGIPLAYHTNASLNAPLLWLIMYMGFVSIKLGSNLNCRVPIHKTTYMSSLGELNSLRL